MPSSLLNSLLLLIFLVVTVLAIPQPVPSYQRKGRSFKVERVVNPSFVKRDGPRQLLKAYRKYAMPIPNVLIEIERKRKGSNRDKASQAATTPGLVPATNLTNQIGVVSAVPEVGDVEYLSPVNIGGQTIMLDFDSGSSDLWVFSNRLNLASQRGHTVFDASKSPSFRLIDGATWSISYGDGSGAAGVVGLDTVNIGGATVTNQAVELATKVASSFVEDTASNGLVGLAYSKLNTVSPTSQKTFFDNAIPSLEQPVFTADLRHNAAGAYEFGTIDATKFNGSLTYAQVNTTQGFWQFSSNRFAVGTAAPVTTGTDGQAIADTGTTLMIVSNAIAKGYYSQVQGAVDDAQVGGITFPCNTPLPDLAVDIGGVYMATIPGKFINFTTVSGNTCFGGVQASTSDLMIFGDVLFKGQFVAFNGGNNTIGMAPHDG